jgi:HK97 family phage portal protein
MLLGYGYGDAPVVGEHSAVTLSAVWRSVSLISGSIASIPLRTLADTDGGRRARSSSFLDFPNGRDGMTAFEWKELVMVHLLLHGNAFLQHRYNGAGALAALHPIHPTAVEVKWDEGAVGGKRFTVQLDNGTRRDFDGATMTQIMGLSLDGLRGLSPITIARLSLGTGISGDKAANRMFLNGAMISGLVTPEEDLTKDEAEEVKKGLTSRISGAENAGDIAVINRKLKFQPWTLSASDAQFLQSRSFQVEEVARWYGLPPHLLAQTEKSTTWGSGLTEQNRGLARYTLTPWTSRIEARATRLLVPGKVAEFDYSAFIQPSPEDEIRLLIEQVNSGLLTLNEARRIRNMPDVAGGDEPRIPPGAAPLGGSE